MDTEKYMVLNREQQKQLAITALVLVLLLVFAVAALTFETFNWKDEAVAGWNVLIVGGLGGLVGGCARSLFMFVREIGGHGERGPDFYRSRWFLYLVKPALGLVSGPLLLLAVTNGLVPAFTTDGAKISYTFLPSLLVSVSGGIFFEEVFALVSALIPDTAKRGLGNVPK